jgi:phosphocarrier protein
MTEESAPGSPSPDGEVVRKRASIVNQRGLHARAAARLAQLADTFEINVEVSAHGMTVSARSIMGLMMLAAGLGAEIEFTASGDGAKSAVDSLVSLVDNRFDEE